VAFQLIEMVEIMTSKSESKDSILAKGVAGAGGNGGGGNTGTRFQTKGRNPTAETLTYMATNVRQYPEMFGGVSTD
jgi:hypothetical protein